MPSGRRSAHQNMFAHPSDGRPYRSHKFPACDACRRRKVRCAVNVSKNSCQYCQERDLSCSRSWQRSRRGGPESVSRPPLLSNHETISLSHTSAAKSSGASDRSKPRRPKESALLMVGPTMAEDIDVLERHLTGSSTFTNSENPPYIQVSSSCGEPIVYHAVPREREGLVCAEGPGVKQREILEQILGPHKTDVIRLYFDRIHHCFPIIDEVTFWDLWRRKSERISATVLCEMYAISLLFWAQSDCLKQHHRPDMSYAWNQAVIALRDDFMAPSIATIHAALLDLMGRPMIQATGNIANIGRTVTLAHSFGLHRNPIHWSATHVEKTFRSRLWWGVLINDSWSSLSHGTPPNICRQNYDVPLPTTELESAVTSASHKRSLQSFAHLCALTQILGDILPLVYALLPNQQNFWRSIRRIECALDDWQNALPAELHAAEDDDDFTTKANGASSLWFYFLSLKLMMHRLMFKMTIVDPGTVQPEARSYRLLVMRDAASTIIEYLISLRVDQLQEFWLPYTAQLLVSASTTLSRCVIEASDAKEKTDLVARLVDLLHYLQTTCQAAEWELGNLCLEQCGRFIKKFAAQEPSVDRSAIGATLPSPEVIQNGSVARINFIPSMSLAERFDPSDCLDGLWDPFWMDFNEFWQAPNLPS